MWYAGSVGFISGLVAGWFTNDWIRDLMRSKIHLESKKRCPVKPASLYRIASYDQDGLPPSMRGLFTYPEAYRLCCEWNRKRSVVKMAWPIKEEGAE